MLTAITLQQLQGDTQAGKRKKYAKGTLLWTSSSLDHKLYFLQQGQIAIMLADGSDCEVILRVVKKGEPFGELCFCSRRDQPRTNCAKATVDSQVVEIVFADFIRLLQENTKSLYSFSFALCERLADAEARMRVLSNRGATSRLGRLLLQLAGTGSSASSKHAGAVIVAKGHDELAGMAAMTRPHVSVTMGKLRALGLVHYGRGEPLTVEVSRLKEFLLHGNEGGTSVP